MVLESWEPIALYFITCLLVPAGLIGVAFLTSVKQRRPDIDNQKHLAFESGVSEGFIGRQRFPISFYLTAMLFIIFDIEMVFLYPLGVVLGDLGLFGFVELVIFTAILLVAYAYVWGRGALEWE